MISFRLPAEQVRRLEELAEQAGRSRSSVAREALSVGLDRREGDVPPTRQEMLMRLTEMARAGDRQAIKDLLRLLPDDDQDGDEQPRAEPGAADQYRAAMRRVLTVHDGGQDPDHARA
jgi:Arc/MetJ-type ribon-helix-helix transcriptional regulator